MHKEGGSHMRHYALIGEKLGHSLSVPIHEAIFAELGLEADYRLIEIPQEGFDDTVRQLLRTLDGFNVTIPYKQRVMPLLAEIDAPARVIGAVNTVQCGAQKGYNTDAAGFTRMLERYGLAPGAGSAAWVLGSGGTARTARASLKAMGAGTVTVVSRHPEGDGEISYDDFYRLFPEAGGLIVNTTPAGMWPRKNPEDLCAIDITRLDDLLKHATGVADVVYNPPETCLTRAAARAGLPWCTGLYMLIAQAVEAEAIWQERPMPEGLTDKLMKELKLI